MSLSHSLSAAEQHNLITNANLTVARFANLVAAKLGNKYFFSREDIEDMASEAIMKAWRSIDSYDPTKAKLSTWVSRIAVNCVKDTVGYRMRRMSISGSMYIKTRKKESESGVDEVILDPMVLNTMSENGADGRILQAELKGRICDVVSEMSDKRKRVAHLLNVGYSPKEIAKTEGCTPNAASKCIWDIREALRSALAEWNEESSRFAC